MPIYIDRATLAALERSEREVLNITIELLEAQIADRRRFRFAASIICLSTMPGALSGLYEMAAKVDISLGSILYVPACVAALVMSLVMRWDVRRVDRELENLRSQRPSNVLRLHG